MNSTTIKQDFVPTKSIKAKLQLLRFIPPLLVVMLLAACSHRTLYIGTCAQQTGQFWSHIHSIVVDELNPVIQEGLDSKPAEDVNNRILKLDTKVSELNTPKCNPRTQAAKELLRLYMFEVRNYFSTVAGRAIYGEGQVQAQLSKVDDAYLDFETALEELSLP